MNRHLQILSKAFFIVAAVVGIPALAGSLFFGTTVIRGNMLAPKAHPAALPAKTGDTAIDVVQDTAHAVGGLFDFFGGIAEAVIIGLAIASLCFLAFSVIVFFTGRGIRARQLWARWVGFLLMASTGLVSLFGILAAGRGLFGLVAAALLAGSGYAIWVLVKCFGPETPNFPPQIPVAPTSAS